MPRKKKTFEDHVKDFKDVHGNKFEYFENELSYGSHTKIEIKCNTCENIFSQTVNVHKRGRGCPYCFGRLLSNEGQKVLCDDGVEREVISRSNAKRRGLRFYFTGKPCQNGHIAERSVSDRRCLVCMMGYKKQYREDNKESIAERDKQYYQENKEIISERNKRYKQENKQKRNAYNRNRYATDEQYKTACIIREMFNRIINLTKLGKTASTFDTLRYSVEDFMLDIESKMFQDMSWENHGEIWHIDHMIPVSRYISEGVTDPAVINALDNLIPMYSEHNLEKSAQTLEEYLDANPELYDTYSKFINKGE